ncbi:MAG: sulfatase-like hydrolase/transferase [Verrucomicrobiota bacterium]
MKHFATWLAFAVTLSWATAAPNIVLIVADDVGYGDLGCYGKSPSPTPHLDELAASGLLFTDYHSAGAMCSPTRASMLTGMYPQRFGSQFDGALGKVQEGEVGLPLKALTIAEKLGEAGYTTACLGKWHLGYRDPFLPHHQGFDVFRGLLSGDGDFHTQVDRLGEKDWWDRGDLVEEKGYTTDLLTDHAVDFIEKNKETPFFLYLPHLAIHFPWQGPEDPPQREVGVDYRKEKFGIIPDEKNVAPHVEAMLRSLDESVGRIVGSLQGKGLLENTLIAFTSDNGGYLDYPPRFENISSNGIYRGQKTQVYEGGHRVPLIISWKGRVAPGTSDALVHSNDWMPTLLELAEVDPIETDGVSLLHHFLKSEPVEERILYWRTRSAWAIRQGPWKLCGIRKAKELYHLGEDPSEENNLAEENPSLVKQLEEQWNTWNEEMNQSAAEILSP